MSALSHNAPASPPSTRADDDDDADESDVGDDDDDHDDDDDDDDDDGGGMSPPLVLADTFAQADVCLVSPINVHASVIRMCVYRLMLSDSWEPA